MFLDIVHNSVGRSKRSLPISKRNEIKAIFLAAFKRTWSAVTDLGLSFDVTHLKEKLGEQ